MHHKRSKMKPEEELPSPGAVSVQVRIVHIINKLPVAPLPFLGYLTKQPLFRQRVSLYQLAASDRIYQPVFFPAGHLPKVLQPQARVQPPTAYLHLLVSHHALISFRSTTTH